MQVNSRSSTKFQPITLTLEIQTEEELRALYAAVRQPKVGEYPSVGTGTALYNQQGLIHKQCRELSDVLGVYVDRMNREK
jgi:hypothetical protein